MSTCCDKNPLQRSGINQQQRPLAGLKPGYIAVDERDFADWIFFADQFSYYIKYYDTSGALNGNWASFFSTDISAILGSIAIQDAELYRRSIKQRFDFIKDSDNLNNLPAIRQKLNELFSSIISLSKALDNYLLKLPDKNIDGESDFGFKVNLLNNIKTKLAPALQRLLAYYFAIDGVDENNVSDGSKDYLDSSDMTGWKVLNMQVLSADLIIWGDGLSSNWCSEDKPLWNDYFKNIIPDDSIYGASPQDKMRINHAVNHNLFSSIFDQYLQVYSRIVLDAEKTLLSTLENWDAHPAHYALFLSFLRLFRFAQSHLNSLTQRHLDFYYKEVLRLKQREAEPNHAHLLVELTKPVNDYALKQATEFKAGKDSEGKDVVYELDEETTFNKAKVVSLKAIYKGDLSGKDDHRQTADPTSILVNNRSRVFASPVANSDDGLEAKLKSAHNEWHPYVNKKITDGLLTDIGMPNAQIGFAIASDHLYLFEGERRVYINLAATNSSDNSKLSTVPLEAYFTTEKGWYKVLPLTPTTSVITDAQGSTPCAQISFILPGDAPAITKYNSAIHGGSFNCDSPLVKIYLVNEDNTSKYSYDDLAAISITKTELVVKTGLNDADAVVLPGLKTLSLSTDTGIIDPSKPFMPFGISPKPGASFIIGSPELFTKKNAQVFFRFEWKDLPGSGLSIDYNSGTWSWSGWTGTYTDPNPAVKAQALIAGVWTDIAGAGELKILPDGVGTFVNWSFSSNPPPENVVVPASPMSLPENIFSTSIEEYKTYSVSSNNGFVKLILTGDFGYEAYQTALTNYLIDQAKPSPTLSHPGTAPYTPLIKLMSLHYKASVISNINENNKTTFDERALQFFHIAPFGETEQHAYLSNSTESPFLLPQFSHKSDTATVNHTGEFYIGIEKLAAEQSVNILFQLLEGSSDPLIAKPAEHIHWSYLSNDQWLPFNDQQISDATLHLVQSGIISFVIPEDATTANTLLPAGLIWIRGGVESAAGAVCKLITVDAQAALVTFSPADNAENFLDTALPAETISKLTEPDSAIKKIAQPYSSFGGRAKESSDGFYVRVSERLRHKARAITIWDYEHLVLEAFPSIHKVKCLNHTRFEEIMGKMEYNEVAPGYVTIITIPDLRNRNDANPLRPYTSQDLLTSIEVYLKEKTSCHVKLNAKNPRFEEISVSFKLKLVKGYDDFTFYSDQLKEEITQYLTPWMNGSEADIQFGGKIQKSSIINFIEERPYVDFITDVVMQHNTNPDLEDTGSCDSNNNGSFISGNIEEAEASTARSILVSVPAKKHGITQIAAPPGVTEKDCPGIIKIAPIVT